MLSLILKLLIESMKAIAGKMMFAVVAERFLSRIIAWSLRKLSKMTTNTLDDELAEEIIAAIQEELK